MRPPRIPVELSGRPFNLETAKRYGVTPTMLQGPQWRSVFNGVWVNATLPDTRALRIEAAAIALSERGFLCGPTAAWKWGIDLQASHDPQVWMATRTGSRARPRSGLVIREIKPQPGDVVTHDGIKMTSPTRTCFDCARWLDQRSAVIALDALSHSGLTSPAAVSAYLATQHHIRNQRAVSRVVELSDPKCESPRETWLRLVMREAGLRPESQWPVIVGELRYRLDFAFVAARVGVEYDGAEHWNQRRLDDQRRDFLRAAGWTIVVVSAADLASPAATADLIAKIRAALSH